MCTEYQPRKQITKPVCDRFCFLNVRTMLLLTNLGNVFPWISLRSTGLILQSRLNQKSAPEINSPGQLASRMASGSNRNHWTKPCCEPHPPLSLGGCPQTPALS